MLSSVQRDCHTTCRVLKGLSSEMFSGVKRDSQTICCRRVLKGQSNDMLAGVKVTVKRDASAGFERDSQARCSRRVLKIQSNEMRFKETVILHVLGC
jgi:hypothetical protein